MILLPILSAALLAQVGTKPLTLTLRATSTAEALRQISQATGVTLQPAANLSQEILILKFNGCALKDAMPKIADALDATWQAKGSGFTLVRTADHTKQEQQKEFEDRRQRMQKSIDRKLKQIEKLTPFDASAAEKLIRDFNELIKVYNPDDQTGQSYQSVTRLEKRAPLQRALIRIESNLEAAMLASLRDGDRLVLAENPNPSQAKMPPSMVAAVRDLLTEQEIWSKTVAGRPLNQFKRGDMIYGVGRLSSQTAPFDASRHRPVVVISSEPLGLTMAIEVKVVDQSGKVIGAARDSFGTEQFEELQAKMEDRSDPAPVPISETSQKIGKALARGGMNPDPAPADILPLILNPDQHDPLSFGTSDAFIGLADRGQANLVAAPSDLAFFLTMAFSSNGDKPILFNQLNTFLDILWNVDRTPGWVVIKPKAPLAARNQFMNRDLLGRALRFASTRKQWTLDDRAALAAILPGDFQEISLALPYITATLGSRTFQSLQLSSCFLRLYGLLNPNQRQAAMTEHGIGYGSLNAEAKLAVQKCVAGRFGATNLRIEASAGPNMDFSQQDVEPAAALPNGIPPTTMVTLVERKNDVIIPGDFKTSQGQSYPSSPMNAEMLAQYLVMESRPDKFPMMRDPNAYRPDLTKFMVAHQRNVTVRVNYTPTLYASENLEEREMLSNKFISYEELPADFKAKVEKAKQEFMKSLG